MYDTIITTWPPTKVAKHKYISFHCDSQYLELDWFFIMGCYIMTGAGMHFFTIFLVNSVRIFHSVSYFGIGAVSTRMNSSNTNPKAMFPYLPMRAAAAVSSFVDNVIDGDSEINFYFPEGMSPSLFYVPSLSFISYRRFFSIIQV